MVGGKEASNTNFRMKTFFFFFAKRFSLQDEILLVFSGGLWFCRNWSDLVDIHTEAKQCGDLQNLCPYKEKNETPAAYCYTFNMLF